MAIVYVGRWSWQKQINFQPYSVSIVHIEKVWMILFIILIQLVCVPNGSKHKHNPSVELWRQNLLFAKNIPFPFEIISKMALKSFYTKRFILANYTHVRLMVNISRVFVWKCL